jgi:hypothetical protein
MSEDNRVVGVIRPVSLSEIPSVLFRLPDPRTGKLARRLAANRINNPYLHRDLGFADALEAVLLYREFLRALQDGYLPFQCSCGGEAHFNPHPSVFVCQLCGFIWSSTGRPITHEILESEG